MQIDITSDTESGVVASISGELDADNCSLVGTRLLAEDSSYGRSSDLIVDVGELGFIDSSGISELLRVRGAVTEAGYRMSLRNASAMVMRTMEIAGLTDAFDMS